MRRAAAVNALAADLRKSERRHGVPQTRMLDTGFAAFAYEWARGGDLTAILSQARDGRRRHGEQELAMSGGDFVRNVKQLADLIRQVAAVGGTERLERAARSAEGALIRGIVALSNLPDIDLEEVDDEPAPPEIEPTTGPSLPYIDAAADVRLDPR